MTKYAITKDFDHASANIGQSGDTLEIIRLDDEDFGVVKHRKGSSPEDLAVFSEEELKAIYWILSK